MSNCPQDFIEAHLAVCHRSGAKKAPYTPASKYYGKRKIRTITERNRKSQCAKKLYKDCLKLGIKPTPVRAEYVKEYERIKGVKS